ncbi:hypothetical protein CK203_060698 [Vitis vinifera]|uniref:Uncharacterized protein n=1 Tax=Vitis vinifera TaxID=29760 RepID=A0A438GCD4_VITVI|nr:hypothetical protein CK203_060698 [Vitis vinifera]
MPKFIMYDGTSNPFDHIMHFRQLMTLDIGNDALTCKIFKQNINPDTPFFESLAKKSPITMDDLFKQANKYYMLEDDVRAASQQVLFTNHSTNNDKAESSKPLNQSRQGGFDLRRILVDLGSSIDFLQMLTYRQIGHLPSALENLRRLLSRFNRVITTFLGDVVLLLQANLVIMRVRFLVVDDLSPYNAIMGRAWLHKMKTFLLRTIKW